MDRITISDLAAVVRSAFHPIKILRLHKGYTLRQLSAETGLHYNTLHYHEVQKRTPQPETVYKIARVLEVNPAELYVQCLEYSMEKIEEAHRKTLRIVAKKNETPTEMLARLLHRQLHPINMYLSKQGKLSKDFLEATKISRATLKNWLDKKNTPTTTALKRVSEELGVTLDDLLFSLEHWGNEDLSDPIGYIERNTRRLDQ